MLKLVEDFFKTHYQKGNFCFEILLETHYSRIQSRYGIRAFYKYADIKAPL